MAPDDRSHPQDARAGRAGQEHQGDQVAIPWLGQFLRATPRAPLRQPFGDRWSQLAAARRRWFEHPDNPGSVEDRFIDAVYEPTLAEQD